MIARLPTFKQFSYPELAYKFIDKKETIADYREGISYLELHGYNVLGIVSDGLKGFVKSSTSTDSNIASSTSL